MQSTYIAEASYSYSPKDRTEQAMSTHRVKLGKRLIELAKSRHLMGLRVQSKDRLKDLGTELTIADMGGFDVVRPKDQLADIDTLLDRLRQHPEVQLGTHVYFAAGSAKPLVPTGELFLIFAEGVSEQEQLLALDEFALELVERRSPLRLIARVTSQSPNPVKVAQRLQASSLVLHAEPDMEALLDEYSFTLPSDSLLPWQWPLRNTGLLPDNLQRARPGADARVIDAWQRLGHLGSNQITIAVIDTGFDLNHPDLQGKVVKPWNLRTASSHIPQGDSRYVHGTPVASLALAATNGQGIVGVAPRARWMPVHGPTFGLRTTEAMFRYCADQGADIILCSWGTTDPAFALSPLKEEAIAYAARKGRNGKGCVIVFAVGNENLEYINYYAAHPDVIAVAASTSSDRHAPYSNRGREVWVCAPSSGEWPVLAARASWDRGNRNMQGAFRYYYDGIARGDHYKHFGGTSAACPLVAGVCALILSANPELRASEVKAILRDTADKIGDPSEYVNGHSRRYGYGRVNADRAVAEALRRRDVAQAPTRVASTPNIQAEGLFRFAVEIQPPQGWAVQVGVFASYANVLKQAARLQQLLRIGAVVQIASLSGKTVYRLMAGPYRRKKEAEKALVQLRNHGMEGLLRQLSKLA